MNAEDPLGIVLAGGAGARLAAGKPKALVEVAGLTLLERAVATLETLCGEVVVAAPAELELPGGPVRRADDPPDAAGPLAGIVAGARARRGRMAIVLGVDFPLVTAPLLAGLLGRLGDRDAVIPEPLGRPQPLVAVYTARALERLDAMLASGERAVTRATAALDADRPDAAVLGSLPGGLAAFLNVNTPDELAAAGRAILADPRG